MSAYMRALFSLIAITTVAACDDSVQRRGGYAPEVSQMTPAAPAPTPPSLADSAPATEFRAVGGAAAGKAGAFDAARSLASPSPSSASNEANAQLPTAPQEVTPGSMLVRTGQASLQVDTLDAGIARVRDVARRTSAVIANTAMEGGRNRTRAATLQLRIPSEHFDEAVSGLSPIGKLESVNVTVQDVGEEFVDVQARVTNARRLEQRLIELLANRTGKLSDVLNVERELARVRGEIERYEGRLRYLRSRASVSTLSVALHEPYPIVAERPGAHPMRDAFIQAWRNVIGVTAAIIASLGIVAPLAVVVAALYFLGRRFVRATASTGLVTNK